MLKSILIFFHVLWENVKHPFDIDIDLEEDFEISEEESETRADKLINDIASKRSRRTD